MHNNIYIELTRAFNRGKIRAVICSSQAVVLHRLALMSKDGAAFHHTGKGDKS
jgi:hypothetical protein